MKLFISWSGPVSQQVAEAFREWFPLLLPALQPFITSTDIDKGAKWLSEISRELEASNFGIVCLTSDNLASQWIAFEAGALSKHLDGKVATVLLGLNHGDVKAPLSMFQGTLFEEADIRKLVGSINASLPEADRRPVSQLETLFPKVWPDLRDQVELIIQNAPNIVGAPKPLTDQAELLVEMMALVRQQHAILSDPVRLFEPLLSSRPDLSNTDLADIIFSRSDRASRNLKSLFTLAGLGEAAKRQPQSSPANEPEPTANDGSTD